MILPIGEPKANSRGFTLIEILLVVVIIGVILVLASPNFSKGYSRFQLNKTVDDLQDISRWAQAMAIGQARVYALSFADDRRSYDLMREKTDIKAGDQENFEPIKGALGRKHSVPGSIHLTANVDRIKFYPDGTIDPANIHLDSAKQSTLLSSSLRRGMMTRDDR